MTEKKLRYSILKTLKNKNNPFQKLISEGIPEANILEQGNYLSREDYITGNVYADNTIYIWGRLTEKGENYLNNNSKRAKVFAFLRELKSWIPFVNN